MRRLAFILALLLIAGQAFGAVAVWDGSASSDWNVADNWTPAGVPISTTNIVFNASSAVPCTLTATAAGVGAELNLIGYTGSLRFDTTLTVSGGDSVTLEGDASYSAGSGDALIVGSAMTLTSDGETFAVPLQIGTNALGSFTTVLGGNWTLTGGLTIAGSAAITRTINGNAFTNNGNLTVTGITTGSVTGTTTFAQGAGTVTMSFTAGGFRSNWSIAGNATLSGNIRVGGGNSTTAKTFIYTSGTMNATGSNFIVGSGAYNIVANAAGLTFGTLTLNAPVTFSGTEGWTAAELISSIAEGAATIGDQVPQPLDITTWSKTHVTSSDATSWVLNGDLSLSFVYKSLVSSVPKVARRYRAIMAGSVSNGSTTLQFGSSSGVMLATLINGTGSFSASIDFTSPANTSTPAFVASNTVAGVTITLTSLTIYEIPTHIFAAGEEYIVTDSIKVAGVSAVQPVILKSSTASTAAYLTLKASTRCKQGVQFVEATDINSMGLTIPGGFVGRVYDPGGVLLRTVNWNAYSRRGLGQGGEQAWGHGAWGRE